MSSAERHVRVLAAQAGFATLTAAARAAGIHRKTLVHAARGTKGPPKPEIVLRIATALRVETSLLDRVFETARQERAARTPRTGT